MTRTTENDAAAPADETIEIDEPLSAEAIAELQAAFKAIYDSGSPIHQMPLVAIEVDEAMARRFEPDDLSFEVPRALVSKLSPFNRYRHISGTTTDFGVTCARRDCNCRADVKAATAAS